VKRTFVLLILLAGAAAMPAHADPTGQIAVAVSAPASAACDAPFEVSGTVTVAGAAGLPRQTVRVTVDGTGLGYGSTDVDGSYVVTLAAIAPGEHVIGADIYAGLPLETEAPTTTILVTGDCEQP